MLSNPDRSAMEKCDGVVVASAIFGDHDKIRQPKGLGAQTLETVCFFMFVDDATLRGLAAHNILTNINGEVDMIGAWRIVRVSVSELPYDNAAMNGVIPKHLVHRLFPNSMFSVWLDAKLQLTVDPLLLIHSLVVSKDADMAISKHPSNVHTMEEAMATARWKKWADVKSLRVQMETYCEMGLQPWSPSKHPYTTGAHCPNLGILISSSCRRDIQLMFMQTMHQPEDVLSGGLMSLFLIHPCFHALTRRCVIYVMIQMFRILHS